MPTAHSRKPSGGQHHSARQSHAQTSPSKHQRNNTAPETPTLLRLPSTSSAGASISPRSRRATNPSTPTLTPSQVSTSSATSPSYFSPQPAASGKDARSPAARRPPASFSGHGIDNSRGPPITLITRGNSDIARRSSQKPSDFAFAQQQLLQAGLVSPGGASRTSGGHRRRDDSEESGDCTPHTQTPNLSRQNSTRSSRRQRHMASSVGESSEYDSGLRSQSEDAHAASSAHGATDTSGTDGEHTEDLFLNIAEDSAPRESSMEPAPRSDRLRSRIARASNRQSFPSATYSPSPAQSSSTTPNASRIPSNIDTRSAVQYRRASHLPSTSRNLRDQSPLTPANPLETPRSRLVDLSPKPSFSRKDSDLSPREFLSQIGRRRPSAPDALYTPPNRTSTYRPSNLNYSSSRDNPRTPHVDTPQETASRADGTESHGSTGPAASVWDELDDLKTRIRRIEMGGKIPATANAVVSQASADRPRTANTSVTTVSSSPKQQQQRKNDPSPSESTVGAHTPHKVHPLLRDALAKAKQHTSPAVYRVLEATASEAIELAELTGSAGPQGTLHSASSVLTGALIPDRQVRRKADNICRSLTELCITMCDSKTSLASPALRSAAANSRRPSVQINGESPSIRQSVESEGNTIARTSPSRAMSRIEARRTSMLASGISGSPRESSQEPPTPSQSGIPNRFNRAGTSLRSRRNPDDDDEDPTLRAPSRAMTDFRDIRTSQKTRFSREYTSQEPMPDLQPSPAIQSTSSLRRPTASGNANENNLLFQNSSRRYNLDRQSSPAYEKQAAADSGTRSQFSSNRNSIGGTSGLSRAGSLSRRYRGNGVGE